MHRSMRNITLRLADETIEELEDEADEHGVSRSEYLRNLVATRHEHDDVRDEHARRIEELERENERLHRERRQLLETREENTELVRYAETKRLETQSAKRRREHNIIRRLWWSVAGEPADL